MQFLPCGIMLSSCVHLFVSPSVTSYYCVRTTDRAHFWHGGFLPPVPHCVMRRFVYLQKLGYFPLGLSQTLDLENFATASRSRCQRNSSLSSLTVFLLTTPIRQSTSVRPSTSLSVYTDTDFPIFAVNWYQYASYASSVNVTGHDWKMSSPRSPAHPPSPGRGRSSSHTHIIGIYRQGRPLPTAGKSTVRSLTSKWDKITDHHTSVYIFLGCAADKCRRHTARPLLSPVDGLPVISSRISRSLAESAFN